MVEQQLQILRPETLIEEFKKTLGDAGPDHHHH